MADNYLLEQIVVGIFDTNCYIVACAKSREAMVVDPGSQAEDIWALVKKNSFKVKAIVNTHSHFDHVLANKALKELSGAPLMMHELDLPLIAKKRPGEEWQPSRLLNDGDEITVGELTFKVLHTPGHSPGGICLSYPGVLFAGDTLFKSSVGRSDLDGGDHKLLIKSIKDKLMPLPDDTLVYPGHGPSTTIGYERANNSYLSD